MSGRWVYAGCRPWHATAVGRLRERVGGEWVHAVAPPDLSAERLAEFRPDAVFLPHWSWIVPTEVLRTYECVGFHVGDLPRHRGGSPVQNLIAAGIESSRVNAFRVVEELDAGPVYSDRPISLLGGAEEIFLRLTRIAGELIEEWIAERPEPRDQTGEASEFRRRTPEDSRVPADLPSLDAWHDHVRMLDASGYPAAFVDHGPWRLHFTRSSRRHDAVICDVRVVRREDADG